MKQRVGMKAVANACGGTTSMFVIQVVDRARASFAEVLVPPKAVPTVENIRAAHVTPYSTKVNFTIELFKG